MDLQAVTDQLFVVDGIVRAVSPDNPAPGLLAQPAPSRAARSREKDLLFVHLTLSGPLAETAVLHQDILIIISKTFYNASGSVTAALRQAIVEANQFLLRHNLSHQGPQREGAVTCCVFRQGELFTLQVGESMALLGRNFGIEQMPPKPPAHMTPLGRSSGIDIRYYHHGLQAGELLLLADPRMAHLPASAYQPALVNTTVEQGMEALTSLVGSDSARLILVEFTGNVPYDLPETAVPVTTAAISETAVPQPRREGQPSPVTTERKPQPVRPLPKRQEAVTPASEEAEAKDTRAELEHNARRAGSKVALGISVFTAWLVDLLARLRLSPADEAEGEEEINWLIPAIIAITIPVLIALIVSSVYLQRGRVQRLSEIKTEMGQKIGLAEEAASDAEARQLYNETMGLAAEADTQISPGDEQVAQLRSIARSGLDRLDNVTRLDASLFYEYVTEGTSITPVILRADIEGGVYTLDNANGYVYEHDTDESYLNSTGDPEQLFFNQQAIGTHIVGSVVDMLWRPEGSVEDRPSLAMLDANGALLNFQPGYDNTFAAPLDLASEWVTPTDIAFFDERLYILDPGAGVIWKYFPTETGFVANANDRTLSAFNDDPQLQTAVDFDIYSGDGGLVILYADGRIRYIDTRSGRIQWDESDLLAKGLGTPLLNPTAVKIIGRGLNASIFVADAGNGRIVQISRPTGQVLAQYRATGPDGAELFNNITSFDVADTPLRILVSKGNTVYTTSQE